MTQQEFERATDNRRYFKDIRQLLFYFDGRKTSLLDENARHAINALKIIARGRVIEMLNDVLNELDKQFTNLGTTNMQED